jgi:hypothetical protein
MLYTKLATRCDKHISETQINITICICVNNEIHERFA